MTHQSKLTKYILVFISLFVFASLFIPSHAVFAEGTDNITETTFFGNLRDDGEGCGVYTILNLVIDILSIGIGIVGVIGISVAGIQYLTAGGNEAQTTKAKRRIFEIVIGLVAYATLFVFLQWLLPGGSLSTTTCQTISDEQLAEIKAREQAERKVRQTSKIKKQQSSSNKTVSASGLTLSSQIAKTYTPAKMAKLINKGIIAPSPVCTDCTWPERIAETAELLSWPKGTSRSKYHYEGDTYGRPYKKWSDLKGAKPNKAYREALNKLKPGKKKFSSMSALGADCGHFVTIVVKYSGHDRKMKYGQAENYFSSHNWKKVKTAKRGDVCISRGANNAFHIWINLGKGLRAEANHHGKNFGHIAKGGCKSASSIWRATN